MQQLTEWRDFPRSDGWSGYCDLPEHGYRHRPRTIGRDSKKASKHFPRVHRAFSLLKLRGYDPERQKRVVPDQA